MRGVLSTTSSSLPAKEISPWFRPEPLSDRITGDAVCMVALKASLEPEAFSTTMESGIPGSRAGHRKFTRVGEAKSTAVFRPLILTLVPPKFIALPDGSENAFPESANHFPARLAIAPGLHATASDALGTGAPESTSMATSTVDDCWAEFTAPKVIRWVPA